jgi:anthranilate synthase component 2
MLLILDNFDSFTFNLAHMLGSIVDVEMEVWRNDAITIEEVNRFDSIVISPGPGLPSDAGITNEVIRKYHRQKKILGVCLGHQAIGEVFGGTLKNLDHVLHGMACETIIEQPDPLFNEIPSTFITGHYHSWVVADPIPVDFAVTARSNENEVMAMSHKIYNLKGVQFHPESVLTPLGKKILHNWWNFC